MRCASTRHTSPSARRCAEQALAAAWALARTVYRSRPPPRTRPPPCTTRHRPLFLCLRRPRRLRFRPLRSAARKQGPCPHPRCATRSGLMTRRPVVPTLPSPTLLLPHPLPTAPTASVSTVRLLPGLTSALRPVHPLRGRRPIRPVRRALHQPRSSPGSRPTPPSPPPVPRGVRRARPSTRRPTTPSSIPGSPRWRCRRCRFPPRRWIPLALPPTFRRLPLLSLPLPSP